MNPCEALRAIASDSDQTEIRNLAEYALGVAEVSITLGKSDTLVVHIPGVESIGHHITIPFSTDGLTLLRSILIARRSETKKIGSPAAPTQHMVDEWLKANSVTKPEVSRPKLDKATEEAVGEFDLKELGL